jgi:hypothetical protein
MPSKFTEHGHSVKIEQATAAVAIGVSKKLNKGTPFIAMLAFLITRELR